MTGYIKWDVSGGKSQWLKKSKMFQNLKDYNWLVNGKLNVSENKKKLLTSVWKVRCFRS